MHTADLCRRSAVTALADTTLAEVARLMRKQHVGCVVIVEEGAGKAIGVVTDRDIVLEVVAPGLDPLTITAGEIMTPSPVVAKRDDDVWWSLKVMRDRGIRRLPVVDAEQHVIGVVALDDMLAHVGNTMGDIAQLLGSERLAETLNRN